LKKENEVEKSMKEENEKKRSRITKRIMNSNKKNGEKDEDGSNEKVKKMDMEDKRKTR
jgi:hypothetical protein